MLEPLPIVMVTRLFKGLHLTASDAWQWVLYDSPVSRVDEDNAFVRTTCFSFNFELFRYVHQKEVLKVLGEDDSTPLYRPPLECDNAEDTSLKVKKLFLHMKHFNIFNGHFPVKA